MTPTEILSAEHRIIEKVLDGLTGLVATACTDGALDSEMATGAIDFIRSFADRMHHGKEEHELFVFMERRGMSPQAGPTAVMRHEHVVGRDYVARMTAALDGAVKGDISAIEEFAEAAEGYASLLRQHIMKEDRILYAMADQMMGDGDAENLLERFATAEQRDLPASEKERHLAFAEQISARFGQSGCADAEDEACGELGGGCFSCGGGH